MCLHTVYGAIMVFIYDNIYSIVSAVDLQYISVYFYSTEINILCKLVNFLSVENRVYI
jgi:hypothetical protein